MIFKLAYNNAKRSFSSYFVYFLTLMLGIAVFYAFCACYPQLLVFLEGSEEVIGSSVIELLHLSLIIANVFVALLLAFLIAYSNRFFIKRRQKEIGLYLVLGMKKSQVASILILETLGASILSFILGLGLGIGLSQLLGLFSLHLFGGHFVFFFSVSSLLYSLLFLFLGLFISLLFDMVMVGKSDVVAIIKGAQKNEKLPSHRHRNWLIVILVVSLLLFVLGCLLMIIGFVETSFVVFIIGSISGFLFFYSASALLFSRPKEKSNFYYRGLNGFLEKELSSGVNSSSLFLAFVALSTILTILLSSIGLGIQTGTKDSETLPLAYVGLYLGLTFMLASSSLLSIHYLNSFYSAKERFHFLANLGCQEEDIFKTIWKEISIYFLYPLLFALLASSCGLVGASLEGEKYMSISLGKGIGISLAIILFIYLIYALITYFSSIHSYKEYEEKD